MGGGCETPAAGAAGRGRDEGTARAGEGSRPPPKARAAQG